MKKSIYLFASLALMAMSACSSDEPGRPDEPKTEENEQIDAYPDEDIVEVRGPITLTAKEKAVCNTLGDFGLDMLRFELNANENRVVSPVSLNQCLGLIANGAAGSTLDEIMSAIGGDSKLTLDELNSYLKIEAQDLRAVDKNGKFSIANSIWNMPQFSNNLKRDYLDNMNNLLLADQYELKAGDIRNQINGYVDRKTRGMIKDFLMNEPAVTNLILLNTLYFNADWQANFRESKEKYSFRNSNGSTSDVAMVESDPTQMRYHAGNGMKAVSLELCYGKFEMLVVVPDNYNDLQKYLTTVSTADINNLRDAMKYEPLTVRMPVFDISGEENKLIKFLNSKGISSAFNPSSSDFSKMVNNKKSFFISDILQKCRVKADADGLTGAAVTMAFMCTSNGPEEFVPTELTIDRPFAFFVRETKSGIIIFSGQIVNL